MRTSLVISILSLIPSFFAAVIVGNDIDVPFRLVEMLPGRCLDSPFVVDVEFMSSYGVIVSGQGRLDINSYIRDGFDGDSNSMNRHFQIHNLTIRGGNNSYVTLPFTATVPREIIRTSSASINFGYNSDLLSAAGSFILYPTSRTGGRLIIRPTDPTRYVMDGVFRYMPVNPQIVTSIVPDPRLNATAPFVLDTTQMEVNVNTQISMTYIHRDAYEYLYDELVRIATSIEYSHFSLAITLQDETHVDLLPIIQFTITNPTDGGEPFNLVMYPRDYVKNYSGSNRYRVSVGVSDTLGLTIGNNLIRTMSFHLDHINGRCGFGESLHTID